MRYSDLIPAKNTLKEDDSRLNIRGIFYSAIKNDIIAQVQLRKFIFKEIRINSEKKLQWKKLVDVLQTLPVAAQVRFIVERPPSDFWMNINIGDPDDYSMVPDDHLLNRSLMQIKYDMISRVTDDVQLGLCTVNIYDAIYLMINSNRKLLDHVVGYNTVASEEREPKIGIKTQRYIAQANPLEAYMRLYGPNGFYRSSSMYNPDPEAIRITVKSYKESGTHSIGLTQQDFSKLYYDWGDIIRGSDVNANIDYSKLNKEQKIELVSKNGKILSELYYALRHGEKMDQDIIIAAANNNVHAVEEILEELDPDALDVSAIKLVIQDIKNHK